MPDPLADPLTRLDTALLGLRHLWTAPPRSVDTGMGQIEMSTIWIVDALARAAEAHPGREVIVADVAEALDVAPSTASRLLDRAESAGAVTRHRGSGDPRRVTIRPTPAGQDLAGAARAFRTGYLARVTADWDPADRARLADLLARFAEAIRATPPGSAQDPARTSPPDSHGASARRAP